MSSRIKGYSLIDAHDSNITDMIFSKKFTTQEYHLRDHIVDGQFNILGAVYIEMARQAAQLAKPELTVLKLTNNYWLQPLSFFGRALYCHC